MHAPIIFNTNEKEHVTLEKREEKSKQCKKENGNKMEWFHTRFQYSLLHLHISSQAVFYSIHNRYQLPHVSQLAVRVLQLDHKTH